MSLISKEAVYHLLPLWMQNYLISWYGKKLYRLRYQAPFSSLFNEIKEIEAKSNEAINAFQLQRLKTILIHAEKYVPYYRDLFNSIGFNAIDFSSLDDLKAIPPLEKDTLRENPELFRSTSIEDSVYFLQKTSGSTGKPLSVDVDEKT